MPTPDDDEPVPRLPRGRGIRLDGALLMRIGLTLALLVMIVVAARPCADATSQFVTGFDQDGAAGSASPTMLKPGTVDEPGQGSALVPEHYEQIRGDMTPEEQKAAIERELRRAAEARAAAARDGSAGRGSAGSDSAGSGSAGSGSADPRPVPAAGE